MAKKFIAVYLGREVKNVVFVCNGRNRCYWEQHVKPFVQGVSKSDLKGREVSFKGYHDLEQAKRFAGAPDVEVTLIYRDDARELIEARL